MPSEVAPTADDLTLLNPDQQHVFYLQELAKLHARHAAQRHFDRTREDDVVADRVRRKLLDDKAAAEYKRVTEPPAPPFDLDTLAGILARPDEPPMRIQGLMPWSGSALVVAQRKTGKTTLLLNYARCLLTGEDFLGAHPIIPLEPGERVAFLNYEVSGKQLARWAHECGSDPDRLVLANLRGRRNPLGHIDDRTQLAKALRDLNVRSVIVDPFGRAYTGVSQNDNGEVQAFLVGLEEFVRSDVGALDLMLATHAGWDGERTRGASALEDWGDTIITLTKDDDGNRFLRAVGRDVDVDEDQLVMDPLSRFLTMTGNGGRKPLSSAKSQAKVAQLAVGAVRAVTEAPGCSRADIKRALGDMDDMPRIARGGRGEELLTTVLKHAERSGAVRCETKGNGHPSAYFPVELSTTTPTTPGALPGVVHHHHPSPYIRGGVGGGGRGLTVREVQGSAYYFDPITRQQVNPETGEVIA